jgi:hypothetical protein
MKNICILMALLGTVLLVSSNTQNNKCTQTSYTVIRLDSINDWYLIYVSRNDSVFKIASVKHKNCRYEEISIGNKYNLLLRKRLENVLSDGGLRLLPMDYLRVYGAKFDLETEVFVFREEGVFGLYTCDNLNGLCISSAYAE